MEDPKENKVLKPVSTKWTIVKVRINPKRAIHGYGKAGDVVEMPKAQAEQYAREGYVTILKEGE